MMTQNEKQKEKQPKAIDQETPIEKPKDERPYVN